MQVEDLAAPQQLPQDGLAGDPVLPFAHKGLHGQSSGRGGGDDGQIPDPAHRHIECPGDGGGGEGEDIHLGTQGLDLLLLLHTEAVFFVDDQQSQILALDTVL